MPTFQGPNSDVAGWREVTLEDVLLPVTGSPDELYSGDVTYVDISSIDAESRSVTSPRTLRLEDLPSRGRRVIQAKDVLFATVRPYRRAIALVPELDQPVASTGLCVLRPSPEIDARYLYYLAQSNQFVDQILPLQHGVSYPAVSDKDVRGTKVAIPPLPQQTAIVRELDARLTNMQLGVKETESALEKSHRLEQVLRDSLFDRAARQFEPRQDGRASEDYPLVTLSDLLVSASYGTSKKSEPDGGAEYVARIPNVVDGRVSITPAKYATEPLALDEDDYLQPGDLLIVRTNGSLTLVGKAALVDEAIPPRSYFASYLIRLRFDASRVNPAWVAEYLASSDGRSELESGAASTSGQKNIGLRFLRSLAVPLPPRAVQDRRLSEFTDQIETIYEERHKIATALASARRGRELLIELAVTGRLADAELELYEAPVGNEPVASPDGSLGENAPSDTRGESPRADTRPRPEDTSTAPSGHANPQEGLTVEDHYRDWRAGRPHSTALVEEYYLVLARQITDGHVEVVPRRDAEGRKISDRICEPRSLRS